MKRFFLMLASGLMALYACTPEDAPSQGGDDKPVVLTKCPFTKGVNLAQWLQVEESYIDAHSYSEKDFKQLVSLGVEAVRLPVAFENFTGAAPDYKLSDKLLSALDKAVNMAEAYGLYIIIDNHSYLGGDFPPTYGEEQLIAVWRQIAARYKNRSDKVIYELQNEPGGAYMEENWYRLQNNFLAAIRSQDSRHTCIVTSLGCHIEELKDIPVFEDKNLLYTFHFYTPYLFTHQGSTWAEPAMAEFGGVPYPYSEAKMPEMPAGFAGTDLETQYNEYNIAGTETSLKKRIKIAYDFGQERGVPLFCGEFGVLQAKADNVSRCKWHEDVKNYLEICGIGWTMWDYRTDFSMFNTGSGKLFEMDLNVQLLEALGFKVPASYADAEAPELLIYDDALASFAKNNSYFGSAYDAWAFVDYENMDNPQEGKNCIEFSFPEDGSSYTTLSFEIWPVINISKQVEQDYELEFYVRTEDTIDDIDVRFMMWKDGGPNWRTKVEMGNNKPHAMITSNGAWQRVRVPLSRFYVTGSAIDNHDNIYEDYVKTHPDEAFDWTKVNHLQFAQEGNKNLKGKTICIDNVAIRKPL